MQTQPKKIAVCQQKGGTGKTTTAAAIGAALAQRGAKILFVDLDPQCNLTFTYPTEKEVISTAYEFLTEERTAAATVYNLAEKTGLNAKIIPASQKLAIADKAINQANQAKLLQAKMQCLTQHFDFDYVIIDTPPELGILTINALAYADVIIIPCNADIYSLQAAAQIGQTITAIKRKSNPQLKVAGIVITQYKRRQRLSQSIAAALDQAAATLDSKVFNTKIRECIAIREAQALQTNLFSYAPKSNAATDYNNLLDEILKEL